MNKVELLNNYNDIIEVVSTDNNTYPEFIIIEDIMRNSGISVVSTSELQTTSITVETDETTGSEFWILDTFEAPKSDTMVMYGISPINDSVRRTKILDFPYNRVVDRLNFFCDLFCLICSVAAIKGKPVTSYMTGKPITTKEVAGDEALEIFHNVCM